MPPKEDPVITLLKRARIAKSQLPELDFMNSPLDTSSSRHALGVDIPIVEDQVLEGKVEHFIALSKVKAEATREQLGFDPFPGSKGGYFCQFCGQECILAPQGQALVAAESRKLTCMDCMVGMIANNPEEGN